MPTPVVTDINIIYGWFVRLFKPTQQQFANTFFSFRHKNDKIGVDDLSNEVKDILNDATTTKGLVVLAPGTTSYTAPIGVLVDDVVILGGVVDEAFIDIGFTDGGDEIISHELMSNRKFVYSPKHYCEVEKTFYFGGVPEEAIIKLYIK